MTKTSEGMMPKELEEDYQYTGVKFEENSLEEKPLNGSISQVASAENLNSPSQIEVNKPKNQKQTKWTSVRNAIKVTSVVKKPMSNKKKTSVTRQDSFLKRFSTRQHYRTESEETEDTKDETQSVVFVQNHFTVLKPDGSLMFYWLLIVTIAVLYNLWTCIVRQAFRELQLDHKYMWITLDIVSDVIYIFDIIIQIRTGFLEQGLMVLDAVTLAKRYIHSLYFKIDLISLLPLDFIQFHVGWQPLLRFPRFLKIYRSLRFLYMLETRTAYPNFVRVANLTHVLFLGCHWFAAFYFMISEAEGFHSEWSYPKPSGSYKELSRKYLASLFWSTLTLTTIGDLPPPETNWEYVFVIGSYLIGVFIFATIVGQVGNVITNRNASRLEFERLLDGAKLYMRMHNVPPPVQRRVQRWYDYVWTRGRMTGSDINSLGLLPDKLKTELAIHVNLETLKKVTIFNECQPEFLHDLVLKMKAYIFTPGDLICRRGEVAREMFIIADGVVEIISESGSVLTQMSTGNFFGEIGILNLDGGINRRTADVKSVGYSELFVLSREDVLEALKDHPDAKEIIRKYAEQRLKQVLQDRRRLKARSNTATTINHLLIYPRKSVIFASEKRNSSVSKPRTLTLNKIKKIFRKDSRSKSKYRIGFLNRKEPFVHGAGDDSPVQTISGSDNVDHYSELRETITENQACLLTKNSSCSTMDVIPGSDNTQTDIPLLNIVYRRASSALATNAECSCDNIDTNIDSSSDKEDNGITVTKEERKNSRTEDTAFSNEETNTKELAVLRPDNDQQCCRCGQLEEKLVQIQKQLISVEKLYTEGVKQLETFTDVNEKYVQILSMISDSKMPEEVHYAEEQNACFDANETAKLCSRNDIETTKL